MERHADAEAAGVAVGLYGTTDWKGDFVPGLLRPYLPVVERNSYLDQMA